MTAHAEEAVVLLAHPDRYLLEEARRLVRIDVEPLPCVDSLEESIARKEIIWGDDNVLKSYLMNKGDVDQGFAEADFIVEGEYDTGAQEQLYIENNGMIAVANPEDGVTVWGSMQCPYYVHKALIPLFGLPPEKIRVIQTETGGGFGGKEEYPSMIAGHAALLAWKSGKPVKMIYDRAEDMVATTKRHPSRTRHRTGVTRDGKLLAMEIDFAIDGGAYATLSAVVLSRGTIHAAGPYFCPNVRIRSRALATNYPAARRVPRLRRAAEHLRARAAHEQGRRAPSDLTPEEFRRRNFLHEGQTTATGQVIRENVDLDDLLDPRARSCRLPRTIATRFDRANPTARIKRGIGFATFMHGAGFTGSGEVALAQRRHGRGHARGQACESSPRPPRSARAPTPFFRRSRPTPCVSIIRRHRARAARYRQSSPTAARRSPRAPSWSSASWSKRPASA